MPLSSAIVLVLFIGLIIWVALRVRWDDTRDPTYWQRQRRARFEAHDEIDRMEYVRSIRGRSLAEAMSRFGEALAGGRITHAAKRP